ncbi:hypothetical protein ABZ353_10680 [Streptomyces niveus]|uniref:hypothetical protein n=1 Tax=Streptomyces niveus TaxID=193462 RepID=UPI0033F51C09
MTTARKTAASKTTTAPAKAEEGVSETTEPKVNTFEYKGESYNVPADPLDLPLEVGLAESEFEIIQEIVGDDQWIKFRKTRPSIRQFGDFSELVLKSCGYADSGN